MRRTILGAACSLALAGCGGPTDPTPPAEYNAAQDKSQKLAEDDERQMHRDSQSGSLKKSK